MIKCHGNQARASKVVTFKDATFLEMCALKRLKTCLTWPHTHTNRPHTLINSANCKKSCAGIAASISWYIPDHHVQERILITANSDAKKITPVPYWNGGRVSYLRDGSRPEWGLVGSGGSDTYTWHHGSRSHLANAPLFVSSWICGSCCTM